MGKTTNLNWWRISSITSMKSLLVKCHSIFQNGGMLCRRRAAIRWDPGGSELSGGSYHNEPPASIWHLYTWIYLIYLKETFIYIYIYMYMYTYVYICIYMYIYVICVYIYIYVICIYIYICIYVYTWLLLSKVKRWKKTAIFDQFHLW